MFDWAYEYMRAFMHGRFPNKPLSNTADIEYITCRHRYVVWIGVSTVFPYEFIRACIHIGMHRHGKYALRTLRHNKIIWMGWHQRGYSTINDIAKWLFDGYSDMKSWWKENQGSLANSVLYRGHFGSILGGRPVCPVLHRLASSLRMADSSLMVVGGEEDSDSWIIDDDASTISLQPDDAVAMAAELGVAPEDLGFSDQPRPLATVKDRPFCILTVGCREAKDALQLSILEFMQQPGYQPFDGSRKLYDREVNFIKQSMRKKGWKLWTIRKETHFTPQWVKARAWRKIHLAMLADRTSRSWVRAVLYAKYSTKYGDHFG